MSQIIFTCLELAKTLGLGVARAEYPDITFRDGLVNDLKEAIDEQTAMLDAGIQSKVGAIAIVKNLSDEKAIVEYEEIQKENNIFGGDNPVIQARNDQ